MSLRAFHIFFIIVAGLFALFLAGWSVVRYRQGMDTLFLAVLSVACAFGLAIYAYRFVRKTKTLTLLIALLIATLPKMSHACAVCFNPENEEARQGLNWAIGFLLLVTALVLAGLTAMVLKLVRQNQA